MINNTANVVIIGGGINGLATAYNLAKMGESDIVLVEREYIASGATGRCGAGIRQQWGTEKNCILSRESVRMFENLEETLDYDHDIEFKQKGYLFLAYDEGLFEQFKKNVKLQNDLNIPSRLLTPGEIKDIAPHVNINGLYGGTICEEDGHANPFHVSEAYRKAAERLGVKIYTYTEVWDIETERGEVTGVITDKGKISTKKVLNTAGGHAKEVGRMAGIELPIYPERHEAMVSEPLDPFQGPMIVSLYHDFYMQQVPHGSFLMGHGDPEEPESLNINSSVKFPIKLSKKIASVFPPLKDIKIIRQWAGLYDMSPDAQPILGETSVKGFYTSAGYSGHGFMIAPYTSKLVAQLILEQEPELDISMLNYDRFERGELILEPSVV
ncbi:FAD-binding oxidoreductase [Natranaerobius thermophilus JW/NM-WN-LF]|uniref:FAD dependent oxidoreductase n=1 Tax=Natranaerobius thermophilus (strain ATCC BAA-1301 / DSM 18059 / JW/NM-WN-LF) TaxID=457570 RepID=B2A5H0_NATTJ|nr:FAD-binding oxidoreductase [Natranaerobius thermophilus]ACB85325.1 FAD dependent oxidoreductase [Natranaerobius thermophilus JW/NM-WN-LF]